MKNFLIRFMGIGKPTQKDIEKIEAEKNLRILDSVGKTLRIETDQTTLNRLLTQLKDWGLQQERVYPLPTTRKRFE
ncbi:hypothetical protein [Runella zeae]|uniref:hypothetical protein n=1 Tax=Runella zeae TaxID=94255 RepID=UPI002356CB83|nr:hypothetical protein [Runella zeae]